METKVKLYIEETNETLDISDMIILPTLGDTIHIKGQTYFIENVEFYIDEELYEVVFFVSENIKE